MNYFEVMNAARQEKQSADNLSSRIKGAALARQQGSGHYADVLRKFLFLLQSCTKPEGISEEDFALFHPICKRLVEKGPLKETILLEFLGHD